MTVYTALTDVTDDAVNPRLGFLCVFGNLSRCGEIKDRRPCVHHADDIKCVDCFSAYRLICHIPDRAVGGSVGRDEVQVISLE